MSQDTTRYDSTVHGNNHSDSGMLHVPAQVQRNLGVCIDTELEVTLSDIDTDPFIDTVSFEGAQTAGDSVTVPAELMRRLDFEGGESVTAQFALAEDEDDESDADEDASDLGQSPGAQADEDEGDTIDDILDELDAESDADEDESEDEQESEGLGELFG